MKPRADFTPGLIIEADFIKQHEAFSIPKTFQVPEYVDCVPYCLPASNQGDTPSCAGFATACGLESRRWRLDDIYEQVDGLAIYRRAKMLDGSSKSDGTTLTAASQAAQKLGLLPGKAKFRVVNTVAQVKYAVHRFGGFVAGFNITAGWNKIRPDGTVPDSKEILGGHAGWVCHYDADGIGDANSWGEECGAKGFVYLTWKQFQAQFMYGLIWENIPR